MSTAPNTELRAGEWPPGALAGRIGFLLKHVHGAFTEMSEAALADLDVDGREYAVLAVLAGERPLSQQQAAQRMAVDRTTMVGLIDGLEAKGFVSRRPDPGDRRRNIVEVTDAGRDAMTRTGEAIEAVETRFLGPLGDAGARRLREALITLVSAVHE